MRVPGSVDHVTNTWLSEMLDQPVAITHIERIGGDYGLASEVYRVLLDGFEAESVVVKLWPIDSNAGPTEVHFFNDLAARLDRLIPLCHHASHDGANGVLVMAALVGRQGDVLVHETAESLQRIASLLGILHGTWWGEESLGSLAWLRDGRRPPQTPDWIESRTTRFLERFGVPSSEPAASLLENAGGGLAHGTDCLAELPATLVHGDLHLDNILFVDEEPVLLDWAGCRRGPGSQDLAALLFGMSRPELIDPLLSAYQVSLATSGVDVDPAALERAVGGAVLWSFVFWTLGTAMWIPVDERSAAMQHRHVDDAVRMVEFWAERDPELFERVLG